MIKILAIDDNDNDLILLGEIIKNSFPEIILDTALTGETGIELAINGDPDMILLDINIPGMDGFEVCRQLKKDKRVRDIPVVFLSSTKENRQNRITALEAGGEAFLNKSVDEPELIAQIRAMVKIKEFNSQKRDETAINISEARLKRAELASKSGNWELHLDTQHIIGSEGAAAIYGLHQDEFQYETIKKIPLPEYRFLLDEAVKKLIEDEIPYDIEFKIKTVDTDEIKDIHSIALFDKEKGILFGIIQDITDRKRSEETLRRSEEKYRRLLELAPDAFFQGDSMGNFITFNDKAIQLTGFSKEELLHMNMSDLFSEKTLNNEPLRYDLLNSGNTIITERKIRRKSGELIDVEMNSKAMPDDTYQSFLRDITERKRAEEILIESEIRLRELNATKDKFFSIIAHDLKNPIGAFMNVSELLANMYETFSKEEILEILHEINSYAKRLFSLLENLLIWSKSQTGKIEIDPDLEKLDLVVSNCISILDLSAENKKIKLINEVDPNIVINADINMITTVIRNLMSNSIKYTMPGGEVKVSAVKDTKFVEVVVSDSGIGMSPETIGKLFRIDQHHTTPGTSNEKGTGLGLILCKEFVEKHNGRIWVTSVEDKGSEFHFTVPMKEDA